MVLGCPPGLEHFFRCPLPKRKVVSVALELCNDFKLSILLHTEVEFIIPFYWFEIGFAADREEEL